MIVSESGTLTGYYRPFLATRAEFVTFVRKF